MLLGAKRCCEVASDSEERGGKKELQGHVVRLVDSTTGYSDVLGLYDCSLHPRGKRRKVALASSASHPRIPAQKQSPVRQLCVLL